jgi:hypothetical protein
MRCPTLKVAHLPRHHIRRPPEEAELFVSLQLMNAEKIDYTQPVQVNGFIFSTPQILADLAWKQTLAEARWYQAHNWDRTKRPPFALLAFPKAA